MPGEWTPHRRCWMAWPNREEAWVGTIDEARRAYAEVAQAIARFEPVTMIASPEHTAQASLYCGQGIGILPLAHDDSWTRDTGPSFVIDGKGGIAGVAWRFNGWGEAYGEYRQDAQLARRILEHIGVERFAAPIVLEGGAIHVDGEGTALVCTPSLLDPKRNPGASREDLEAVLAQHLGVETVIWLPAGLVDDETGGHVDNVACFVRPGVVLAHATDDKADANFTGQAENLDVLRAARDAHGRSLEVLTLPQPRPQQRSDGRRLSLSYVNFYIANGAVIMPAFRDPADQTAYRTLVAAFPDRQVVQIEAVDIVVGGGGIHCITQQEPAP
jgi:agmatine deiminase